MVHEVRAQREQFELPRHRGDGKFQISVSCPDVPPDKHDVPLLIVTDADITFGVAAEISRLRAFGDMHPKVLVVGVGYGAAYADFAKFRTPDLTPPTSEAGTKALGKFASFIGEQSGNADGFLDLIVDVLVPEISRRYPQTSEGSRLLYGHSLGGLFTAHALLTRPDVFDAYLVNSPSLWWDQFAVLSRMPTFEEKLISQGRQPRVLVTVGSKEQDAPTRVPPGVKMELADLQAMTVTARMVDAAAEFADALRKSGLKLVEYVAFQGEDHGSVVPAAISRGLAFALPDSP